MGMREVDNPDGRRKHKMEIELGVQLPKYQVQQRRISATQGVKVYTVAMATLAKCYTRAVIPATHQNNFFGNRSFER